VFNIRVGPADSEWDAEGDADQDSRTDDMADQHEAFNSNHESQYGQPVNYPMYMPPYSPPFDQTQQPDPYQVQANYQMLGSPYTSPPVYAGAPCGQINLSPAQPIFPFNTFPIDSTSDQTTPMSPHDYRSPSTYYQPAMDTTAGNMTAGESFALQMSPPQVSDIPADYSGFDGYQMDFNQNPPPHDSNATNASYGSTEQNQGSYQTYESENSMLYNQQYHSTSHHHTIENPSTSDSGMYVESHYPVNNQGTLDGFAHRFNG
jgi:hypothetical protein